MQPIRPKKIAEAIISTFDVKSCQNLDVCIERAIRKAQPKLSALELAEIVESIRGRVAFYIGQYISECQNRQIAPRVTWSSSDPDRLIGRCFISGEDTEDKAFEKKRMTLLDDVWGAIASKITPGQFEVLCKRFLEHEGFTNPLVTGRSHDGGIDLKAVYNPKIRFGRTQDALCQAKRYGKDMKIGISKLREFFGAVKSQGASVEIAFFFTTATLSREARDFAEKTRVWTADGEQMAYWLVRQGIGFTKKDHEALFSLDVLIEWLNKNAKR